MESATPQPDGRETNSRGDEQPGLTPLAIAAVLALALHLASGIMLDRSHAGPAGAALDNAIACVTEASPLQPSLPYD